jgi:hypothetical protein
MILLNETFFSFLLSFYFLSALPHISPSPTSQKRNIRPSAYIRLVKLKNSTIRRWSNSALIKHHIVTRYAYQKFKKGSSFLNFFLSLPFTSSLYCSFTFPPSPIVLPFPFRSPLFLTPFFSHIPSASFSWK